MSNTSDEPVTATGQTGPERRQKIDWTVVGLDAHSRTAQYTRDRAMIRHAAILIRTMGVACFAAGTLVLALWVGVMLAWMAVAVGGT